MTLQASGTITMAQINAEFGRGNDLNSYRGTTWYTDAGASGTFSSGAISMSDFYGKRATSPMWTGTITTNQNKLNLRAWAIANGYSGSGAAQITIASGVYIYSDTVGTPALTIDGSWGGLTLINNGYVMGMGGTGGGYSYNVAISPTKSYPNDGQTSGSAAISLGVSCTIQNNSYIGGGGGGGGSCLAGVANAGYGGGGGAGGGAGGTSYLTTSSGTTWYYGGAGGAVGSSGANGNATNGNLSGGGGGRIMPGSNTTLTLTTPYGGSFTSTGGGANTAGSAYANNVTNATTSGASAVGLGGSGGGTGGGICATGYYSYASGGGGGGGYGASGGTGKSGVNSDQNTGAAGGYCVALNGYSVTWSATGTRYGAIA